MAVTAASALATSCVAESCRRVAVRVRARRTARWLDRRSWELLAIAASIVRTAADRRQRPLARSSVRVRTRSSHEVVTAQAPSATDGDDDRHAWERPGAHEVRPGRAPHPAAAARRSPQGRQHLRDHRRRAGRADRRRLGDGRREGPAGSAVWATIGYDLRDVREFLVTHMHRDHYTQAVAIRRVRRGGRRSARASGPAWTPIRDDRRCTRTSRTCAGPARCELSAMLAEWRRRAGSAPTGSTRTGGSADGIDIAAAHAHAAGDRDAGPHRRPRGVPRRRVAGALFAGDHVLPHITPSIGVELIRPHSPLRDYLGLARSSSGRCPTPGCCRRTGR